MTAGPDGPGRSSPGEGAGPAPRMTDLEALMWRLGRHDARMLPTMAMLVRFDRPLDRVALRDRLDQMTRRVPRLRERVGPGLLPTVPPRWEADPQFRLDRHVKVARVDRVPSGPPLSAPADLPPELIAVAEDVVSRPFPEGHPPWRVVLVPGAADALVLHLHHSYTDGLGGVRLLGELFDDLSAPGPSAAAPAAPPSALDAMTSDLDASVRRSAGLARRAVPWGVRSVRSASGDPQALLRTAADAGRAVRSALAAAAGPASPVLRGRSGGVSLATLSVPLDGLRRAGGRLGATVNDVFLGGLLEGLARYHEKCAVLPPSLRLAIPMSARPAGEDELGMQNQLHGALLRGPLGPLEFEERTRLVHEMVVLARRQPWLPMLEAAAGLGLRTPGMVGLVAAALRSLDVVASNVTGPPFFLALGGARAEAMVPVGPRSGGALNATLLSYAGTAHVGLNIDPQAVADPGVLVDCVRAAFEDHLPA